VMDQGVIQQVGAPMELFDYPVNRFVAQFVGTANLFSGSVRNDAGILRFASPQLGDIILPTGLQAQTETCDLTFRPHAVRVGAAAGMDCLALEGSVETAEFLGEFLRYELRVGSVTIVADVPHARGRAPLDLGSKVALSVPASELRFV